MKPPAAGATHQTSEPLPAPQDFAPVSAAAHARALVLAALTAMGAALIPALYWVSRDQLAHQDLRAAIALESGHIKYLLQNQFNGFELIARSVKGFIDGSERVTLDEFRGFVHALNLKRISPGLQGVGLAQWVAGDNAWERAQALLHQEQGSRSYQVQPAGARPAYAPIVFMEPLADNHKAIGFDLFTAPLARTSAQRAQDSGELIATEKMSLVQDAGGREVPGFVLYLAVYAAGPTGRGGDALRGWVDLPFRLVDVLQPIASNLAPGLQLAFHDPPGAGPGRRSHGFLNGQLLDSSGVDSGIFSRADHLPFAGRDWHFSITPTPEYVARHAPATHYWVAAIGFLLSLSLGLILFLLLSARDRAKALANEMTASLRATSAELNDTLDAIPDLLFEMDLEARFLALRTSNPASLSMPMAQMAHKTVWQVMPRQAAQAMHHAIQEANTLGRSTGSRIDMEVAGQPRNFELSIARKRGLDGLPARFIVLSRDITERTRAEQRAQQLAYFDDLTGLPNRRSFLREAPRHLAHHRAHGGFGALFLIDLDNLKTINDHWGHQCGDAVLQSVAGRITRVVGVAQAVARWEGNSVVVVLSRLASVFDQARQAAAKIAQEILQEIGQPMAFGAREHYASASIGIAMFDASGKSLEALISGADSAMYHAKNSGRNTYRFFDRQLQAVIAERAGLEQDMRAALDSGQFHLVYQPQVDLQGRVTGAEALCRWQHPEKGPIAPAVFIDVAEKSGFIFQLGQWVLQAACEVLRSWSQDEKLAHLGLAVNVSAKQFQHPDFLAQTRAMLGASQIDPTRLELELTESIFAQDGDEIAATMAALKSLGIGFSLDDFGTGYSSLNYLKRLPLDQLKIDQSFVRDVISSSCDASIVESIISLGKNLGLRVLAEGVETAEQLAFLQAHGCRHFQGYLFSRPLAAADFVAYVQRSPAPLDSAG